VSAFWVAFLMPLAILIFLGVLMRLRFPPPYDLTAATRGRIVLVFVVGVILTVWCVARLPSMMNDNALYFTDPSCTSGTSVAAPASAACRSETVGIAATRITSGGRSGTHYYMTLMRANGARTEIEVRVGGGGPVWRAASATPGQVAQLQLFRGRPVLVSTDQGILRTKAFPNDVLRAYQFWLAFGAGMVFAAIADAIYSWRSFFA
jgi:hypothetical protein